MSGNGDIASALGGEGVDTDREDIPTGDFTPMPPAWYPLEIDKAEVKPTKDGSGKYLWLQVTVLGENYANRKLFPRFNLVNKNAKAVEIGQRDLAGLGAACGLPVVSDTSELVGKQVDGRVKVRKDEGYEADNEVTAWAAIGSKSSGDQAIEKPKSGTKAKPAAKAAAKAAAGEAPAKPAAAKRPWER